jgi:hypothetical protein
MDPGSTPQWVGQAHFADQLADFKWHRRPTAATSRLPSPEQAKPSTMPADDCLWLDDHQDIPPGAIRYRPAKTSRSKLLKTTRFDAFLCSTLSWCRSVKISASSESRDRKRPMTIRQISLSMSPMPWSIARFAALRRRVEFTAGTGVLLRVQDTEKLPGGGRTKKEIGEGLRR